MSAPGVRDEGAPPAPDDHRMGILYIAPWVDLGGSDKGTIDWFKHLDAERWAPSLITTQPSRNRWLHQIEPYAEEVWELPDLMPGGDFPEFILGFIESRDIRVVHIMNSRLGFDLLADMTCLPKPPAVVVQIHAEEPDQAGYVRYVTRRYGNLVDAFSVTSEHVAEIVRGYEIPPSRIEVIHSGVDAGMEFDPDQVEPLELPGGGTPRILWPGRLAEQKDPLLTLEVVKRARERGAEFTLEIVGDGHLESQVRARAEETGVADMIGWHPPSQEMPRWYRSSDLLLMTSVYEGVPYVIYESLAMGVPVIAPALPGNLEFMDADSGVIVDPRDDADAYAEAIVALLGDEERRSAMGERSRRRMLEQFSLEEMGRRHGELYERLLAGRSATSRWRNEQLLGDADAGVEVPEPESPAPIQLPRRPAPERSVGVVVPCYRHGIFLPACIESIKAQTLAPAAIVVVDDGSEDPETVAALADLDDDPEVVVLRQPENLGPSAARNRGLAELETSYVLPIDADDELLPEALEQMVARLECAPIDVGFVYPHARHIGNRSDLLRVPAYNLWLLMAQNYCPAPALFDRRLFDATGIGYPEEIVVGHEDWDLILQLGERGVRGIPADAPTFLYRQQGLSRVNAVDFGPDSFQATIERRHPALYGHRDEIKRSWAPAVSIVLLDEEEQTWSASDILGLERQTCRDFEVLAAGELDGGVRSVAPVEGPSHRWLQRAVAEARGRVVLTLSRPAAALLDVSSFVEQLLYAFRADDKTVAVVLAPPPGPPRHSFGQLGNHERLGAEPAAVAFRRVLWSRLPEVELGRESSLMADLVVSLQVSGLTQWRAAPVAATGRPARAGSERHEAGGQIDLNLPRTEDRSEGDMRTMVAAEPPRLPELTPGTVRRWGRSEPWTPPQTQLLYRHRDPQSGSRIVNLERSSPPGMELDRLLGAVSIFPAPGLRRLVHANHGYELSDIQDDLPDGHIPLGWIEQQPLPMLEGLELRVLPEDGQRVLVAGPTDPLFHVAQPLAGLGFFEPVPILPRIDDVLRTGQWRLSALRREVDASGRHRCFVESGGEGAGVCLGGLYRHPFPSLVELRQREDGRLVSELNVPGRASRNPRKIARWVAAPAAAANRRHGPVPAARAAGERLRDFAAHRHDRRLSEDAGLPLGWLRRERVPGTSILYSTVHPVTGDQMVTRVPEEATAAGYVLDGVLGAIVDPPAGD